MLKQLFVVSVVLAVALAYPSGPPDDDSFCDNIPRVPLHGKDDSTDECPFMIVALPWVAGEFVQMGVLRFDQNDRESRFRGFAATITSDNEPIGTMRSADSFNRPQNATTKTLCGGTTLSHADRTLKSEVLFEWMAPEDLDPKSELELRLTIVGKDRDEQWVDCRFRQIGAYQSLSETDFDPTTDSTESSTQETTTAESVTTEERRTTTPVISTPSSTIDTTPPTTVDTTTPTLADTTTPTIADTTPTTEDMTPSQPDSITPRKVTPAVPNGNQQGGGDEPETPVVGGHDAYLGYSNNLKHTVLSAMACEEGTARYTIVEGTDCTHFEVNWGHPRLRPRFICPTGNNGRQLKFDPRVCTCAPTTSCPR